MAAKVLVLSLSIRSMETVEMVRSESHLAEKLEE
jgi:hypothetical protein